MKTFLALASIFLLSACAQQPIDAPGIYRLSTAEQSLVLDVRASGDYVLQINGPERNPDEIRGRWTDERGAGRRVSFQGLLWRGTEPEAGQGVWAATVRRDGDLCLDSEGLACFSKDEAA